MFLRAFAILFLSSLVLSCGGGVKAPKSADGKPITLFVFVDRGIKDTTPADKHAGLNELGEWLEKDIVRTFEAGGYTVKLIKERGAYTYGTGEFLMTYEVENYSPADPAYAAERGLGTGEVSMDAYAELFTDSDQPLLKRKDGFTTSRGWQFAAETVNKKILPDVSKRIRELQ